MERKKKGGEGEPGGGMVNKLSLQFMQPQKLGKYSVVSATIQKMLEMEGGDH